MKSTNNNNQKIINRNPGDNQEITLSAVKIALKRILLDYEAEQQLSDVTFDIYNDLQSELGEGFAEPTVRKWVNATNNELPRINQLATISKHVKNRHALDVAIAYLTKQAEGLK